MGQFYQIKCTKCDFEGSFSEGTTMKMVDESFTVACDACCNIETRNYTYPEDRPLRPAPATGWWGRKKRLQEIDDHYAEVSARWNAELDKRREEALGQPCSMCGEKVHRVNFGDPFTNPIPVDIGCPSCKEFGCMTVCLQGMYD